MISFKCPVCNVIHQADESSAGSFLRCTCNKKIRVPGKPAKKPGPASTRPAAQIPLAATGARPQATAEEQPSVPKPLGEGGAYLTVACSECGKKLRAPESAAGKAVRCKCGTVIPLPKDGEPATGSRGRGTVASDASSSLDIFGALSELPAPAQAVSSAPAARFWNVPQYAPPKTAVGVSKPKPASAAGNPYLANAYQEKRDRKKSANASSEGALGGAMGILIIVGLLIVGFQIFELVTLESQIKELGIIDPDEQRIVRVIAQIIIGGQFLAGLLMIMFGALIYQFPRTCTVAGMVVYCGVQLVTLLLNPMAVFSGIIFKILIIIGLVKAINSAFAYQR